MPLPFLSPGVSCSVKSLSITWHPLASSSPTPPNISVFPPCDPAWPGLCFLLLSGGHQSWVSPSQGAWLMFWSRIWCPKAETDVPKQSLVSQSQGQWLVFASRVWCPKAESGSQSRATKPGTVAHVLEQSLVTQSRIGCPKAEFGVPEQSLASQSRFWCLKADFGVPKHSLVS